MIFLQISDYHFLPDTAVMAEKVKVCLQESEELPRDFTSLFDFTLYQMDTRVLPDALKWVVTIVIRREYGSNVKFSHTVSP